MGFSVGSGSYLYQSNKLLFLKNNSTVIFNLLPNFKEILSFVIIPNIYLGIQLKSIKVSSL